MSTDRWMAILRMRTRTLLHRKDVDAELDEELRFCLEERIAWEKAQGVPEERARQTALREIAGMAQCKEACREARHVNLLNDAVRDVQYAARGLRRNPGFALLAIFIMALGIGANAAVFSVVHAVLLASLPYQDPDQIVALSGNATDKQVTAARTKQVSVPNFLDWQAQSASFTAMAYYTAPRDTAVVAGSAAAYVSTARVSNDFWRVFGVTPAVGRFFDAQEQTEGATGATLISDTYWQNQFGRDPHVLGRGIRVYGKTMPIVGVLPPGFHYPEQTDLWVPANAFVRNEGRGAQNYLVVARLKPGASLTQAQTEMRTIAQRLATAYPESNKGWSVNVRQLRDELVGDIRPTLLLAFGGVGLLLLIAGTNLATLLVSKATARTREIAVRIALGASQMRVLRQLITESALLALLGAGFGLAIAFAGMKACVLLAPASIPRINESTISVPVLLFTLALAVVITIIAGLLPARHAARMDVIGGLTQTGTRAVIGGTTLRYRNLLVMTQIALAVILLAAAGLLLKSFQKINTVVLGFDPRNVLVMRATVPGPITAATQFYTAVLPDIRALPGVVAAGATMAPPGHVDSEGGYFVDHMPDHPDQTTARTAVKSVIAPQTFAALGIPLKAGRDLNENDTANRPAVAIINEALARQSFGATDPLGRTIFCPFDANMPMTIVGVVGDVRQRGPASDPMPECYMSYRQHAYNGGTLSIVVHTRVNPGTMIPLLRAVSARHSPAVPMRFTTMEALIAVNIGALTFRTFVFGAFAAIALLLCVGGVYGVMAFLVGQRSPEIGLRMALGATKAMVLRLVLAHGLLLTSIGLGIGLTGAVLATRLLTAMLFGVQPNDPAVYALVIAAIGAMTLAGAFVPALRAASIDPASALRQD